MKERSFLAKVKRKVNSRQKFEQEKGFLNLIETEDGYVILKCISTFNREETEANKVKIVAQRKREVFGAQYDAFVATLTKELNQKLWDSVELVDDENVTTTGFMEVYEKYFHS